MRTKHYIYEIFGKKIGATNNVERRMKEQNVKEGEYRIIEEHTNAKTCSIREIELQKEFNYPVDKIAYWKTLRWQKKSSAPEVRKKAVTNTDYSKIDYSFAKMNKPPQSAYSPEAQAKRVAKIDWKASRAKVNWKEIFREFDWKSWSSKIDWESRNKKLKKPVNQYDLEGNFIKQWECAKEAAQSLGYSSISNIRNCCKGKQKTYKKFIWKYE